MPKIVVVSSHEMLKIPASETTRKSLGRLDLETLELRRLECYLRQRLENAYNSLSQLRRSRFSNHALAWRMAVERMAAVMSNVRLAERHEQK